ncbi:hypothetical protein KKH23_00075 [Patescibacteria group bacterium]|nr:hypothetical protein [Patescibacteria group bacterium]MBU0776984.1 hypothetical protein [Patescibacteria group bacterium]MBU0845590.1 hypothetical protein [Patescibacteria group bacterium]MBU0923013.1 hypothetical protein [Patescibacteria group bacterium]MBU1066331.1 hypothetical protein [Patescibacteria group bacterium]
MADSAGSGVNYKKTVTENEKSKTVNINTASKTPVVSVKKIKPDLRKKELPLVDIKVTNPITYLKSWWKRIIGNEGIEFRIKVRPLTAIAISLIIVSVSLGIGRFILPFNVPFFEYTPTESPSTTQELTRNTAFTGTLRFTEINAKYYLITTSSEAIALEVPENIDLKKLVDRRIFATGKYNENTRTLVVNDASDLEIFPEEVEAVPTTTPSPVPTPAESSTPTPEISPSPAS